MFSLVGTPKNPVTRNINELVMSVYINGHNGQGADVAEFSFKGLLKDNNFNKIDHKKLRSSLDNLQFTGWIEEGGRLSAGLFGSTSKAEAKAAANNLHKKVLQMTELQRTVLQIWKSAFIKALPAVGLLAAAVVGFVFTKKPTTQDIT